MDLQPKSITEAIELGREIREWERLRAEIENNMKLLKAEYGRVEQALAKCWEHEGRLKRGAGC